MMGARVALRRAGRAWLAPVLLLAAGPVAAEVGVVLDQTPNPQYPTGPYVLKIIVDDPGPIGLAWTPFHSDPFHVLLNPNGAANADGPPAVLRHPDTGVPIVAWSKNSPGGYDVVVSRFVGSAWTPPEVVAGGGDDERDPSLLVDSTGTVHLFYWVDGASKTVQYRQAPADLSSWSAAEQVSDPAEVACRPAGGIHDGVLRVAYEVHDFGFGQTPRQVALARREGAGFVKEVLAISQHSGDLWPRVHSRSGRVWVDWIDSDIEAAWLRKDAQGYWEPIRYEPYADVREREFHVRGRILMKALD